MQRCDCMKTVATGNVAVVQMTFKQAGEVNEGHSHTYHHFTLIASGRVRIEAKGGATEHGAGAMVWISKGVEHRITALEPFTVLYCIHALHKQDDPGDVLDDAEIPGGVPPPSSYVPLIERG